MDAQRIDILITLALWLIPVAIGWSLACWGFCRAEERLNRWWLHYQARRMNRKA